MDRIFSSAQFAPFVVLLAAIIGVGLYVDDIGVMTNRPEPEVADVADTESAVAPGEPLALTESATNDLLGMSLQYPGGWQADTSQPEAILLSNPANPQQQIQVILTDLSFLAQNFFGLPEMPEDDSPQGVLSAFADLIPTLGPGLEVMDGVQDKTVGDLSGGYISVLQTNPQTGETAILEVNLLDVVDDDRYVTTLLVTAQDNLEGLRGTVDAILESLEISEPASIELPETGEDVPDVAPDTSEQTGDDATGEPADDAASAEDTSEGNAAESVDEAPEAAPDAGEETTEDAAPEASSEETGDDAATDDATTQEDVEDSDAAEAVDGSTEDAPEEEMADETQVDVEEDMGDESGAADVPFTFEVPEGYETRTGDGVVYIEQGDKMLTLVVADVATIANQYLGLAFDSAPNNDVAVNLMREYADNAAVSGEYETVSGLLVTNAGTQAYLDLTESATKSRVIVREMGNGQLMFAGIVAPVDEFGDAAGALMDVLDTVETGE
jgi:hypothetical protein